MKVTNERKIEMMPLENSAAIPQQAIRGRLRTAKEMVDLDQQPGARGTHG